LDGKDLVHLEYKEVAGAGNWIKIAGSRYTFGSRSSSLKQEPGFAASLSTIEVFGALAESERVELEQHPHDFSQRVDLQQIQLMARRKILASRNERTTQVKTRNAIKEATRTR
jgi:hypothetical protein